jgi:4-amino-4-deoxy-L-arabinose transferase-like glycosyltransferase
MKEKQPTKTIVNIILISFSIFFISSYLYISLSRYSFPFAIEWVEDVTYLNVLRIIENKPIYTYPSYDFVPSIYTPLYYYLVTPFASATQNILLSMRITSLIASIICGITLLLIGSTREFSLSAKILSIGFYFACYAVTGYWYDLARTDSTFMAFIALSYLFCLQRSSHSYLLGMLSGIAIVAAVATKQNALIAIPFLIGWLLYHQDYKRLLSFALSVSIGITCFILFFNYQSQGLFWIYIFDVPKAHPIHIDLLLYGILVQMIIPAFYWFLLGIGLYGFYLLKTLGWKKLKPELVFCMVILLPLTIMSLSTTAKQGGYINGLIPLCLALSLILGQIYTIIEQQAQENTQIFAVYLIGSLLLIAQFNHLRYPIQAQIPTQQSVQAGTYLVQAIKESPEPIFSPVASYLLHLAGKTPHFQVATGTDLVLAFDHAPELRQSLGDFAMPSRTHLEHAISTSILFNGDWYDRIYTQQNGYNCEYLPDKNLAFNTLTGLDLQLNRICRYQNTPQTR